MNKAAGGGGGGGGPTAAAAAAAAQKQKTLLQRADTDVTNIVDNFNQLVNLARVSIFRSVILLLLSICRSPFVLLILGQRPAGSQLAGSVPDGDPGRKDGRKPFFSAPSRSVSCFHRVGFRWQVQAAESLRNLVSELKQTAIFSGFGSLNENVDRRIAEFNRLEEGSERLLERVGEQAAASLKELEAHYYSSVLRTSTSEGP